MANMTETDRSQYERQELSVPSTGVRLKSKRPLMIYTALSIPLLGVLIWSAVSGIDGWGHLVVLGAIVMLTIGVMIAINPRRRGW